MRLPPRFFVGQGLYLAGDWPYLAGFLAVLSPRWTESQSVSDPAADPKRTGLSHLRSRSNERLSSRWTLYMKR
jgi:hypothetical protein